MAWCPFAKKMELQPESDDQPAIRPTQFIVHSIVAPWTPERTYEYWHDSTNLESHFGLGYDGSLAQYIGTQTRADANAAANLRSDGSGAVSLESASNLQASDPWTDEQVETLIRLGVWLHQEHGIPLRICCTWDDSGFGYHRQFSQWNPSAHSCPGDARVKQFRERVFPGIVARATGKTQEDDMPDYVNLGLAKPYTLKPGAWDSIEYTQEWADTASDHATGGSVFVRGAARFTGSISLTIEGLPVGEVVQVRMSEYEGDEHKQDHPIDEITGTAGGSFGVVPLTKRLAKGRGIRVRLLNQSDQPVTVTSAVLTALVWKEG
ncbi:N-acetylmuramoyl-L-alanine amidase [Streptomyces sp. TRM68367]|uniref:peptidoglycan recognition protein family protein n=1 Tax=Streptomyces sp. TRM68367 TaxID=2758415 RepID=UPI00165A51C2|nr:N-acetylmuramoyl-L-alanine amidase [Streptomyces sp. TRM68367]MBC9729244.1 N-acetylmuramoyl-L-alanine amidase [Streptomyces sp. TRM68367]